MTENDNITAEPMTIDEIDAEMARLHAVKRQMVGSLYPRIVDDAIVDLLRQHNERWAEGDRPNAG